MTKQNKNCKDQTNLKQIVKSIRQLILKHDDEAKQPVKEIAKQSGTLKLGIFMKMIEMDKSGFDSEDNKPDPYAGEYNYKSWRNQFRELWLQSEKIAEEQIKTRAFDT